MSFIGPISSNMNDRQMAQGAWLLTPEHSAYIDDVETEEPYRRRGFAQALMQRMHL